MAEEGTYRALPQIDDSVLAFVVGEGEKAGFVDELASEMLSLEKALNRVDSEMAGLKAVNPNLAALVRGSVDSLYGAFSDEMESETDRVMLRIVGYFNAFILLRALDMQWRKLQER